MASVLVVDDRPTDRELMATLLGYAGHAVIEASGGQMALDLARERRPQLIITDILMPGMNGYDFVRRLRDDPEIAATEVIFCTATYLEEEVRELAAACGVTRFINKPCPAELVLATIAEALSEPTPRLPPISIGPEFEREQLRVINSKLVEKVGELERVSDDRARLVGLLMSAQEEERDRIAVGVHDDSLQTVVAVGLRIALLRRQVAEPKALTALDELAATVKLASQRLRSLVFDLRPPELLGEGLLQTLRLFLKQMKHDGGPSFALSGRVTSEPDPATAAFLYRAGRELLINARKHAQASRLAVTLTENDGRYVIRVCDNGIGFDGTDALRPRPGHLGLAALAERIALFGGALRITSTQGAGATVELDVPAEAANAVPDRHRNELGGVYQLR